MKIKISIIIPAYNVETYIEKCITSIMNQSLKELEIIVVNDGSSDNTLSIINNLMKKDKRIVLVNKVNGGLSSARNAGLNIAKGEYIQHLDGDDYFLTDGCEKLYTYAKENDIDMLIVDYMSQQENGSYSIVKDYTPREKILDSDIYLDYFFRDDAKASVCSKLIKRDLYQDIRHPEEISLGEDLATTPRLALRASKIQKYNGAFLQYTYNRDSITRDGFGKKMYQLFLVFDVIREDFREQQKLEKFQSQILELETMRISSFFVMEPYWNDENYLKGLDLILQFLQQNNAIPKKLNIIKKIILKFLMRFPTKLNLKYAIKISNILSQIKN